MHGQFAGSMTTRNAFMQRRPAKPKVIFGKATTIQKEQEAMVIFGQAAGSKNEYYVSKALDALGWEYGYQVPVFGGRTRRGGQVLDFLVYTPGRWTIVDVLGSYWHTGKNEDRLSIQRVVAEKKWRLVEIWDYQCNDVSAATTFLRARLGSG